MGRATVQRWVAAYRDGGLDALRRWDVHGPESELAAYREQIVALFTQQPARTVAEAAERIYQKRGVRRQPTQVRKFLKDLGLSWQRVRAIPIPPKKPRRTCSGTKSLSRSGTEAAFGGRPSGTTTRVLRGCSSFRVRHVPLLPVVVRANLRARGLGAAAIQRPGVVDPRVLDHLIS